MAQTAIGLAVLAAEAGVPPAALAVVRAMAHRARPVPIDSARSADQLAPSPESLQFAMEPGLYARIAALYPAPALAIEWTEEAT